MNKLIIVRHGEYGPDDRLNSRGRAHIEKLSNNLKQLIGDETVLILSSIAVRAVESAEIIAAALGVEFEKFELLWSESMHPEDFPGAYKLIQERKEGADVLIVVTHLEYANYFPSHFARMEWGSEKYIDIEDDVEKGEAVIIDCIKQTLTLLE